MGFGVDFLLKSSLWHGDMVGPLYRYVQCGLITRCQNLSSTIRAKAKLRLTYPSLNSSLASIHHFAWRFLDCSNLSSPTKKTLESNLLMFQMEAATASMHIQCWWRCLVARKKLIKRRKRSMRRRRRRRLKHNCARKMQALARRYLVQCNLELTRVFLYVLADPNRMLKKLADSSFRCICAPSAVATE